LWRRPRPKLGCGAKERRINVNKSMQDPQINTLSRYDKVNAFTKELDMWKMTFYTFEIRHTSNETRDKKSFYQPLGCSAETVVIEF
jgi:hypothetical protein